MNVRSARTRKARAAVVLAALLLVPSTLGAEEPLWAAVAANFTAPMAELAERFESEIGHAVSVISGSTGKHYAQIVNGAPFDVFLAADERRPLELEREGLIVPGSRFSYAVGRLVLWSRDPRMLNAGAEVLSSDSFRRLAIANGRLAPYGRAAREVLERHGLLESLSGRLVQGENVAQTFQFVASGNAELGFVALSQVRSLPAELAGSSWLVPADLHTPIEQQAVLLKDGLTARRFLEFMTGEGARALIRSYGYETP
jgi:molybdate transport system substrate-binding protein